MPEHQNEAIRVYLHLLHLHASSHRCAGISRPQCAREISPPGHPRAAAIRQGGFSQFAQKFPTLLLSGEHSNSQRSNGSHGSREYYL